MTDQTRKIQLATEVDATGARQGFEDIKQGGRDMAQSVAQAAQQAGQAIGGIGNGAAGAAQKIEGASRSIADSIKRIPAAAGDAAGATDKLTQAQARYLTSLERQAVIAEKGKAAFLDLKAAQLGVTSAAEPYIAKIRQAESGQNALGMSAKATAAALRGVPAQFTDIAVALQSGQRPLTVLLQQGGQLKDMFGGIGPAARALGGYIAGLVTPFTVATAAVVALGYAYYRGSQEARDFQNALITSGNAVGLSASQYSMLRDELAGIAGTKGKAAEALTEIAKSGIFAGDSVKSIAEAAILMERATGQSIDKTVSQFKRLADEPSKASADLNKQTHYLTAAIYEQIKALEEAGKQSDAAALAMKAYGDAQVTVARQVSDNAGYLERAARGVGDAWKWAWDQVLGIGRDKTGVEELAALREELARRERKQQLDPNPGAWEKGNDAIRARIAYMERVNGLNDSNAKSDAARAKANQEAQAAIDAVTKANEKALTKQQQMNKALDEYRANIAKIRAANPASALLDPKKIASAEQAIRDQYKETARKAPAPFVSPEATEAAKQYAKFFEDFVQLETDATAKTGDLNKAQALLVQYLTSPAYQKHSEAMRQIVLQQAYAAVSAEQMADAQKESAKAYEQFSKAQAESEQKGVTDILKRVSDLKTEAANYGLLESQIARVTLARLQDSLEAASLAGENTDYIRAQIEAQKELVKLLEGKEIREANKKAATEAEQQWQRTSDQINQSLTDALMRGFESGKGFAQNLRDTLKNLFGTLVLRPVIQAVMAPISGSLVGFGQSIGSAVTGGGGSVLGAIGNLGSSLGGLFGGGSALGSLSYAAAVPGLTSIGAGSQAAMLAAQTADFGLAGLGATASAGGAGILGGALSGVGAALPWIGGALAIASLLGVFKKGGGPKQDGVYGQLASGIGLGERSASSDSAARTAALSIQSQYDSIVKAYGGTGGIQYGLGFSMDPKGTSQSFLDITGSRGGKTAFTDLNLNAGRSQEELQAAITEMTSRALLKGLQESNLSGQIGAWIDSLNIDALSSGELAADVERLNKAMGERQTLEEKLYQLTHTEAENLAHQRDQERAALDETNRALYDHVAALTDLTNTLATQREALVQAYQSESAQLQSVIDRNKQYAQQLRDARDALFLGSGSTLTRSQQTAFASASFGTKLSAAIGGNEDALQGLSGAGTALIEAARQSAKTPVELAAAVARVQAGLTTAAASSDSRASVAQQQLDAMTQQLSALGLINTSVLSVGDALAAYLATQNAISQENLNYTAELAKQQSGTTTTPTQTAPTTETKTATHPTALSFQEWVTKYGGQYYTGSGADQYDLYNSAYQQYLSLFAVRGYAGGGLASGVVKVGEQGTEVIDLQTPGRVYTSEQTRGMFATNSELVPLLREILTFHKAARQEERMEAAAIVAPLSKMDSRWKKFDNQGMPPVRTA